MEKVAVYARVSTEEQRERQSIETQIEYAKQYCQREEYLITDFYGDASFYPTETQQVERKKGITDIQHPKM